MYAEAAKVCGKCGLQKSLLGFHKQSRNSDGLNAWCKECVNQAARQPERKAARREYHRAYKKKWRQIPDVKKRLSNELAAKKYGITVDQVLELRSFPSCQCCGAGLRDDPNHKHIDHCHDSGDVRGIVCRACNLTLQGTHDECVMRLKSCLAYLERHRFKALA